MQYNLANEPWLKYSLAAVADRGLRPSLWSASRVHEEALYFETRRCAPHAHVGLQHVLVLPVPMTCVT